MSLYCYFATFMSNVYTAYVRVRRRDNEHLTEEEIAFLFNSIVRSYDDFGSYYVRIVKKYRPNEKCLDIQFGSGKRYYAPLEERLLFDKYYIVERESNEGGLDNIFEYIPLDEGGITRSTQRPCFYKFNGLLVETEREAELQKVLPLETAEPISSRAFWFVMEGGYRCANYKGFVDMYDPASEALSPRSGYDEDYAYDYFVLTRTNEVNFVSPAFLTDLQQDNFATLPDVTRLIFLYNERKVLQISKAGGRL
jgi:hypothetical protein